jgi:L-lysine exporter family protein LysE/ArgO
MAVRSVDGMLTSTGFAVAVAGLLFGFSLIVAIGPQNAFILRQGATREHVLIIVVLCSASDAVLIAAGVAGGSALLDGRHWLLSAVRVVGAAFLFAYAALAARRARRPGAVVSHPDTAASSRAAAAVACLAFTWLNPAVYLDTVVLLGSVASTHPGQQWWFASGAAVASVMWFSALAFGAGVLARAFRRPRSWQILDVFVAVVMVATGVRVLAHS